MSEAGSRASRRGDSPKRDAQAPPPRLRPVRLKVRTGERVRLVTDAEIKAEGPVILLSSAGRQTLEPERVGERELEIVIPEDAVAGPESVKLWLVCGGRAAGPAAVRVSRGPLGERAEWLSSSIVRISGDGFGDDLDAVGVVVGEQVLSPVAVESDHVDVELEASRSRPLWVSVRVNGEISDAVLVVPRQQTPA